MLKNLLNSGINKTEKGHEMESFWSDAIIAIVSLVLGFGLTIGYQSLLGRRGNIVVVKRISQTPEISVSQRIEKDLKISYQDQPVEQLVINRLTITNEGNKDLEGIELELGVRGITKVGDFVSAQVVNDSSEYHVSGLRIDNDNPRILYFRPYLKRIKAYKDENPEIQIISQKELDFTVSGGGKDWQAKYIDGRESGPSTLQLILLAGFTSLGMIGLVVAGTILNMRAYVADEGLSFVGSVFAFMVLAILIVRLYDFLRALPRGR